MDLKSSVVYLQLIINLYIVQYSDSRIVVREKRQNDDDDEEEESKENYLLPPYISSNPFPSGNHPFPGRKASNLYPEFPFSHQFSQGLDVNPGNIAYINGGLNIPDPSTGEVFDLRGKLLAGPSHTWINYGHLIQPVNTLNVSPKTVERMVNDPEFQAARANAPIVPVAQLPSGWRPVHCKPPICNPFVHTTDVGVQIEPGDDGWFDGSIDFPILHGQYAGKRFPLSGAMYAGTQPIYFVYGHHLNPVNPFPKAVINPGKIPFRPFNEAGAQPAPPASIQPAPPASPNNPSGLILPPNAPQKDSPPFVPSQGLPPMPPGTSH